jgi:curli biogenesis system outer membrane secretion channel CsgG
MLATSLVKTGKFSVIEREKLKAILNEQALGKSGAVTPQSAAQVGRLLGVKYIVTGAVSEFGVTKKGGQILGIGGTQNTARATVDIRLVDTNSGEIILADTASSTDSSCARTTASVDASSCPRSASNASA